ncbi:mechanosensitive ion channel [Candidatus Gracilibacteria bacterium]|nr:mechanosensitive ion channel [Candidatus Gracilibacteria bacterium]
MKPLEQIISTFLIALEKLWDKDALIISLITSIVLVEIVAIFIKRSIKRRIFAIQKDTPDRENPEYYLEYYKKGQVIDIIRVAIVVVVLGVLLVSRTSIGANFFIVVAGALIVTFRDFILSILAFFIILRRYKIGETVGIGDIQGQIISIRMFTIGLLGKDNDGDNTGRHFTIPGYRFLTETIRREELQVESIRKELIKIPYDYETYSIGFSEFIKALKAEIETILPIITKKNCGNFQTYIGYKYKMDIDYLEDKCIVITIGLVGKWRRNVERKEQIISWAEQYRVKKTPKEPQI